MNASIVLALAAMLCFGLGDFIYKRAAVAGAPAHQFMMVQSSLYLVVVAVFAWFTATLVYSTAALWGLVSGVFMVVGFYNFAASLKAGAVSIVAPVFRLSFVLTAALAIAFLDEPLTGPKAAGITLALAAAWLLLGGPSGPAGHDAQSRRGALVRAMVATVAVGIGYFIMTIGLRAGAAPATLVVVQACVVTSLSAGFALARDRRFRAEGAVLRNAPFSALALAAGFVLLAESMARGQTSVVVPIAQMGFVVAAMVGFLFLREAFSLRKGSGIVFAVAALACLAHG
ncbi:MAG: EamA family transporter [Burkholderiales bacterium]